MKKLQMSKFESYFFLLYPHYHTNKKNRQTNNLRQHFSQIYRNYKQQCSHFHLLKKVKSIVISNKNMSNSNRIES